jgi:hypothetical protein
MIDKESKVQGYSVYAELGREDKLSLVQFFITPDGYTEVGQFVPARLYYRQLHSHAPKRQWRITTINESNAMSLIESGSSISAIYPAKSREEFVIERLQGNFRSIVQRLIMGSGSGGSANWKLIYNPIVVEVSNKDMRDVALSRTPTKVVYRIQQAKKGMKYPEALTITKR